MPTIEWLATAVIQDVVAIQGVVATRAANPNVVSRNAILAVVFVILVVVKVAAPMVRVRMVVAGLARVAAMAAVKTASAVPVAIPIAADA